MSSYFIGNQVSNPSTESSTATRSSLDIQSPQLAIPRARPQLIRKSGKPGCACSGPSKNMNITKIEEILSPKSVEAVKIKYFD